VIFDDLISSGHETFVTMASGGGGDDKRRLKSFGSCKSKVWKYFGFPINNAGIITDKKEVYYRLCYHRLSYRWFPLPQLVPPLQIMCSCSATNNYYELLVPHSLVHHLYTIEFVVLCSYGTLSSSLCMIISTQTCLFCFLVELKALL